MSAYLADLWNQWGRSILAALPKIAQSLLVVAVAVLLAGRAQGALTRVVEGRGQRELARLLGRLIRIVILLLCGLIVLGIFGQTSIVASFIASLGIVGLVLAFALQDITKNFAAGVLLLIQRPFGLDDRILVGTFDGIVTDITLRATALRTADGHEVLIPNAEVYSGPITNLSRYKQRRITIGFTIPQSIDPQIALPRLLAAIRSITGQPVDSQAQHAAAIACTGLSKDDLACQATFWVPATTDAVPMTSQITLALEQVLRELRPPSAVPTAPAPQLPAK